MTRSAFLINFHIFNINSISRLCFLFILEIILMFQIVNDPINLPDDLNPQLSDILEGLLCKGE